jgi:calcium-dependent protein kinase
MELCKGKELFNQINAKRKSVYRYTERQIARIIYQLIMTVNYLNANDIVHRDIKPENIMFVNENSDVIKLIDFGTATKINIKGGERMKEYFGSPFYIAPEVLKGNYNQKCDIWSIGVIFFTMIMKRTPFDGKNDQEIIDNILYKPINFHHTEFKKISGHSLDLMKQFLFKDEKSRITA